jgi:hypothetical protein
MRGPLGTRQLRGPPHMRMTNASCLTLPRRAARFLALCCLGAALACSEPVCDVCTSSAIIYGRVLRTTGEPIAGSPIVIEAHQGSCASGQTQWIWEGPVTGPDGSYRTQFRAPAPAFTACPRVTVELPGGVPDHVTVDGSPVEFRNDLGSSQPRDSVRVDVAVP